MMNKYKKILSMLLAGTLLLFALSANAAIASTSSQATGSTELSWDYLFNTDNLTTLEKSIFTSQFGDIMFTDGGRQSAVGYASGLLAPLCAMLLVGLTCYVIGGGAINTAASGQMLGKSWSSVWLPLRFTVASGTLLQVKGTYAVIQVLVIYLIMSASIAGTAIYRLTAGKTLNAEATISAPAANMLPPDAAQLTSIAGSAICANNSWRIVNGQNGQEKNEPLYEISYRTKGSILSTTKVFNGAPGDSPYSMPAGAVLTQISFGKGGECGSFSIGSVTSRLYTDSMQSALAGVSQVDMKWLNYFSSLEIDAYENKMNSKRFYIHYNNYSGDDEESTKFRAKIEDYSKEISSVSGDYSKEVIAAIQNAFKEDNADKQELLDRVNKSSWIEAANNITTIQKFSGAQYEALGYVNQGVVNTTWQKCIAGSLECKDKDGGWVSQALDWFRSNENATTMPMMQVVQKAIKSGSPKDDGCGPYDYECAGIKFDQTMGNRVDAGLIDGLAAVGVVAANGADVASSMAKNGLQNGNALTSMPSVSDFQGHGSPIIMLQSLGLGINTIATSGFAALLVLKVAGHAAGDSVLALGGGAGISAFVDVIWNMTSPMLLAVWLSGMTLAYITPWILVIRWIWVVFNWAFGSMLAVAAAPLLPVMMAVPEGEGIAGSRAERGIVYLVQQALTPSLNVVALFGTLAMQSIFFGLINMVWFSTIGFESQGLFSAAIKLFLYVIVQSSMVWSTAEINFKAADAICSWFGGGQSHGIQSNVSDKMEGVAGKADQMMGAGMKGALGALGKKGAKTKDDITA
jgi:conjugal transfer/type IV secretion protein DotA/TraY